MAIFKKKKKVYKKTFNSQDIKRILLNEFRYNKNYTYACTECGRYSADVLLYNIFLIEIEVKCSLSDFYADFRKKKHLLYLRERSNAGSYSKNMIPNKFYFAVSDKLYEPVNNFLKDNPQFNKYGIIVVYPSEKISIKKSAKLLHSESPSQMMLDIMIRRMSSEICVLYNKLNEETST